MSNSKGFTLIEIIVVLVIAGAVAAMVLPNMISSVEQTRAQTARQNLMAIIASQQKYFEDHGNYCVGACGAIGSLYGNLRLQASDTFTYSCAATAENVPYNCSATDGTDTLTLDPNNTPPITCAPLGAGCFD